MELYPSTFITHTPYQTAFADLVPGTHTSSCYQNVSTITFHHSLLHSFSSVEEIMFSLSWLVCLCQQITFKNYS